MEIIKNPNLSDKILITGGQGFLGRAIVAELSKKRYENLLVPHSYDPDLRVPFETEYFIRNAQPHTIIHCAAKVGGIGFNQREPGILFYDNIIMGVNVIHAAWKYKVEKVVLILTTCCYPEFATVPFTEVQLWNGYPEPTNAPYGIAKRSLLTMAQAYRHQYGLNIISLIPANLYGPGEKLDRADNHVIIGIMQAMHEAKIKGGDSVTLWGSGIATRDFLFVKDAAEGIVKAMALYDEGDPINLGTGEEVSIKSIAYLISTIVGFKGRILWDETRPNGQLQRGLDISRAKEYFGFKAKTTLYNGLVETYNYVKNNAKA